MACLFFVRDADSRKVEKMVLAAAVERCGRTRISTPIYALSTARIGAADAPGRDWCQNESSRYSFAAVTFEREGGNSG